jgi:deazaflavin-dependent oxidoreductase (nitroreductase family)
VAASRVKSRYLWMLSNTLNRATRRAARSGHGPFSLIRHVGRKTGKAYETPVMLARTADGFVAELTYGPDVAWYRNIVAAGQCAVVYKGAEYAIDRIEPCSAQDGLRAFGHPRALILRLLRRREFRLLHERTANAP